LGFGKLNQLLPRANNFPIATVRLRDRCEKVPELPAEIPPAAHHPNQHRKLLSKNLFPKKKVH